MDDNGKGTRHFDTTNTQGDPDLVRILPDDVDGTPAQARQDAKATSSSWLEPYDPAPSRRATGSGTPRAVQQQSPPPEYIDAPLAPSTASQQRRSKNGPSACAIVAGTFAILVLSCLALAFATFKGGVDGLGKLTGLVPSLGSLGLVTTPTVTIDTSRPSVVESVRALSRLETVHYQVEKIISGKSSGPLPDFLTSDKILLVAHGEVIAGIDLSKLRPQDIEVNGTAVTMTLPAPEILVSKLDNDKTYVYDRQTGLFNKPDANLKSQLRTAAEQQIVLSAQEDGILDKAKQNAEDTVRSLVKGLGYQDVEFKEAP